MLNHRLYAHLLFVLLFERFPGSAAVVGCTEVLVSSPEFAALTEDQQQCIETIHASGGYLLQLTNDVLGTLFAEVHLNDYS